MTPSDIRMKLVFPTEGEGDDGLSLVELYLYESGGIYLQFSGTPWLTGLVRLSPDTARAIAAALTQMAELAETK